MRFDPDGAQLQPGAALPVLDLLRDALGALPQNRAGVRVSGPGAWRPVLSEGGVVGTVAAGLLGKTCQPVRAVLFDKTASTNWALGWHQDRTIVVRRRVDVEGFGPWTVKAGLLHVEPPFAVLAAMATLRVHLDDVPADNAPLLVAPGSHQAGRMPAPEVPGVVARCGIHACLARAGDVWAYATPVLHASDAAKHPARRRVLQVDYAAGELPGGLQWLGV